MKNRKNMLVIIGLLVLVLASTVQASITRVNKMEYFYGVTLWEVDQWDINNKGFASCKSYEKNVIRHPNNWHNWRNVCMQVYYLDMQ